MMNVPFIVLIVCVCDVWVRGLVYATSSYDTSIKANESMDEWMIDFIMNETKNDQSRCYNMEDHGTDC